MQIYIKKVFEIDIGEIVNMFLSQQMCLFNDTGLSDESYLSGSNKS